MGGHPPFPPRVAPAAPAAAPHLHHGRPGQRAHVLALAGRACFPTTRPATTAAAVRGGEAGKVVRADQEGRRRLHGLHIEAPPHQGGVPGQEGVATAGRPARQAGRDVVDVRLGQAGEAGRKVGRGGAEGCDPDGGGQQGVEGGGQGLLAAPAHPVRQAGGGLEGDALPSGVDARVRAAGALEAQRGPGGRQGRAGAGGPSPALPHPARARHGAQRRLQRALHRGRRDVAGAPAGRQGLQLEAGQVGAVVGQGGGEGAQGRERRRGEVRRGLLRAVGGGCCGMRGGPSPWWAGSPPRDSARADGRHQTNLLAEGGPHWSAWRERERVDAPLPRGCEQRGVEGLQRPHSLPAPLPLAQTKNAAVVRCLSRTAQPSPRPRTRSHTRPHGLAHPVRGG